MDITGFDQQIGVVRKIAKAAKKASTFVNKKTSFLAPKIPMPKVVVKQRVAPAQSVVVKKGGMITKLKPSQIRVAPARSVAPTQSVVVKKGGMITKLKPSQIRVAPVRSVAPTQSVVPVKRSMINKLIAAKKVQKPTQKSPIVTAKQFKSFQNKTQGSQPVKVFSTDQTPVKASPMQLLKMDDVKRSFARVDLPFQPVTPPTKKVKLKNTPLDLPVNINMIEPAVDGGVKDYYGK